jgi:SAM-dependent methyltransferase
MNDRVEETGGKGLQRDEAARANEALWDREVAKRCGYTIAWLDLDAEDLRRFAAGELADPPERWIDNWPEPQLLLGDVAGKDVLLLGLGGGQQSVVYALLGARVTSIDFCRGQVEADVAAAKHYGYEIRAIQEDMRDTSALADASFDVVEVRSTCYIPDLRPVHEGIARVLRPAGRAQIWGGQPAVFSITWDEGGYRIAVPYCERVLHRDDGGIEYRHYVCEQFNGLLDAGLTIRRILERVGHPRDDAPPGSWGHESSYVRGEFIIVANKPT